MSTYPNKRIWCRKTSLLPLLVYLEAVASNSDHLRKLVKCSLALLDGKNMYIEKTPQDLDRITKAKAQCFPEWPHAPSCTMGVFLMISVNCFLSEKGAVDFLRF